MAARSAFLSSDVLLTGSGRTHNVDRLGSNMGGRDERGVHGPAVVDDLAVSAQLERTRLTEALAARDAVVYRLANAYVSIRQKTDTINCLHNEKKQLLKLLHCKNDDASLNYQYAPAGQVNEDTTRLEGAIQELQEEIQLLKNMNLRSGEEEGPPPCYTSGPLPRNEAPVPCDSFVTNPSPPIGQYDYRISPDSYRLTPSVPAATDTHKSVVQEPNELDFKVVSGTKTPEAVVNDRYAILAALPLPAEISEDVLKPITIPTSCTFQEFLASASGTIKNLINQYRIFQESTTTWCPDREEHGYFLTPLYRCYTNPRVATAHGWKLVDPVGKMINPTECFYNKDGKWYYAGVYKALRLADLTLEEWESLSTETSQALLKETLAGRKNTSPANIYETGQLYSAGCLKVACIGLQCVGFNSALYRAVLDYGQKCTQSSRSKVASPWSLGPGVMWTSSPTTGVPPGVAGPDSPYILQRKRPSFTFGEATDEIDDGRL